MATKENVLEIIDLIGNSKAMQEVQQLIEKASQCKANVLITGESGTGKTVVANEIHNRSAFKQGPFVVVNCGTIPYSLIESELFGYERGSFTGAFSRSKGKFEQAQNGTIFLDEIGELPKDAQVKLLGVLQSKKIITHPKQRKNSEDLKNKSTKYSPDVKMNGVSDHINPNIHKNEIQKNEKSDKKKAEKKENVDIKEVLTNTSAEKSQCSSYMIDNTNESRVRNSTQYRPLDLIEEYRTTIVERYTQRMMDSVIPDLNHHPIIYNNHNYIASKRPIMSEDNN